MTEDRIDLRTAESRKLLRRLEAFSLQLREKIAVQKGQLEIVDDLVNNVKESIDCVEVEENLIIKKAVERDAMRGAKTPKRKKREN
jgi:hypothetical protein